MLASYASHSPVYFIDNYIYIKIYFNFMCVCVCAPHVHRCLWRAEDNVVSPGTVVTCSCELPDMSAEN